MMAFVSSFPVPLQPSFRSLTHSTVAKAHIISTAKRRRSRTCLSLQLTASNPQHVPQSHISMAADQSPPHATPIVSESTPSNGPAFSASRLRSRTIMLLGLSAGVYALARLLQPLQVLPKISTYAASLGTTKAALLLACVNFCTVLFCFPANMGLMVAAGALLPSLQAFCALFISKTLAAAAAFALGRTLLQRRATRFLEGRPRLRRVLLESGQEGGWKFVLLMRLSPFPGFMLNYLLSMTGVSFVEYVIATMIGIAPSVINLVLIGAAANDVRAGVLTGNASLLPVILKVVCVASMAGAMVFFTRLSRRAFKDIDMDDQEAQLQS